MDAVWYVLAALSVGLLIYTLRRFWGFKERFAANLRLLATLREREGGPLAVEDEVFYYPSLLDFWSRRLESQAILWRVDRFFGGKDQQH